MVGQVFIPNPTVLTVEMVSLIPFLSIFDVG